MAELPKRRLGDSELEVSVVGLGCNNFGKRLDLDGTAAVLDAALEAGITFFDTADVYGERRQRAPDGRGAGGAPRRVRAGDQVRLGD